MVNVNAEMFNFMAEHMPLILRDIPTPVGELRLAVYKGDVTIDRLMADINMAYNNNLMKKQELERQIHRLNEAHDRFDRSLIDKGNQIAGLKNDLDKAKKLIGELYIKCS